MNTEVWHVATYTDVDKRLGQIITLKRSWLYYYPFISVELVEAIDIFVVY